jgi:membrane-associated protease RseP (regulator of RpoE activity)
VIVANAELRQELENLGTLLAALPGPTFAEKPAVTRRGAEADNATEPAGTDDELPVRARSRFEQARRIREQGLAEELSAAGFSETDAQHIEMRVEELRVAAMQQRYEALRGGGAAAGELQTLNGAAALRAELGDAQYERFLEATGRPTRVDVANVLSSSAAETAGIQSGDEIVAYGGERVFDVRDLNRVLLDGDPGEPVVVDVVREGQPIQVVIPRGPLGISSGFGRRGAR